MDLSRKGISVQHVKELEQKLEKTLLVIIESAEYLDQLTYFLANFQGDVVSTMQEMLQTVEKSNGRSAGTSTPNPPTKSEPISDRKVIPFPKIKSQRKTPQDKDN